METSVGGYCAVLLPMSSPLSSCPPSLFCYPQHPWNFSFLHTVSAWMLLSASWHFCPPWVTHMPFTQSLWLNRHWVQQGLGCFKLGSALQTHSLDWFGILWLNEVPDPLNQRCNVICFLLTVPFLHMLCQSLPFAGQLFFYQFPWRCACVHVCLRVWASERGWAVKEQGCVISSLWVLSIFLKVSGYHISLWHSAASLTCFWPLDSIHFLLPPSPLVFLRRWSFLVTALTYKCSTYMLYCKRV